MRLLVAIVAIVAILGAAFNAAEAQQQPKCGVWQGDDVNWTCEASVPCPNPDQQRCAVVAPPVTGALPDCECTTCALVPNAAGALECQGTCPFGRACQRSGEQTCTCSPLAPTPPPPTPQTPPSPPTPAPVPTPPAPCGVWEGTPAQTPAGPVYLCSPPQCSQNTARLCGLLEPLDPASTAPPVCACSTCRFNATEGHCVGKCPLGMRCGQIYGTQECQCEQVATPPPPPCGEFAGDTRTYLCTPDNCRCGRSAPYRSRCTNVPQWHC